MNIQPTSLPGVLLIEPKVFGDARGWFMENWRSSVLNEHGICERFAQVNTSSSRRGVLRGLHFQWPKPQGKLVWVTHGTVFDVAVDIRTDSATFGQWFGTELSAENHRQLWVPEGFAHGFQVLSEQATFTYLCSRIYHAEYDAGIAWDDAEIGIDWPEPPSELSDKDQNAPTLEQLRTQEMNARTEKLPKCASC